jgi:hypothetical protein
MRVPAGSTFPAHLLPGAHTFEEYAGGQVSFKVDAQGNVTWDQSFNGVLTSTGQGQLTVQGVTVTIDATALPGATLYVDYGYTYSHATSSTFPVTLLPGAHLLSIGGSTLSFTVAPNGTITWPTSEDNELSSPRPYELIVNGVQAQVSIDVSRLGDPVVYLDSTQRLDTSSAQVLTLATGTHTLATLPGGTVTFQVGINGVISYESSLDGVLGGRSTNQLTVNGVTVNVSQQLSSSTLVVDYYTIEQSKSFTLHLLPGSHVLSEYAGGQVPFKVDANGNLSWDQSFNGVLTSTGPGQLTVQGVTVTIDATALSSPTLYVDYGYTYSHATSSTFPVTLLPGTHLLSTGGATISFTVNPNGTITWPTSENNDLSVRQNPDGTEELIVNSLS